MAKSKRKRYTSSVGNSAVQEVVAAVLFYGTNEGCVITNSSFTPSARSLAQETISA
jgi:restriction system protein